MEPMPPQSPANPGRLDSLMYGGIDRMEMGCVYFAVHIPEGLVKIGYTGKDEPYTRFKHLRATNPPGLRLLGWMHMGGPQLERNIHRHMKPHWITGEWFDFGSKWGRSKVVYILYCDGIWEDDDLDELQTAGDMQAIRRLVTKRYVLIENANGVSR